MCILQLFVSCIAIAGLVLCCDSWGGWRSRPSDEAESCRRLSWPRTSLKLHCFMAVSQFTLSTQIGITTDKGTESGLGTAAKLEFDNFKADALNNCSDLIGVMETQSNLCSRKVVYITEHHSEHGSLCCGLVTSLLPFQMRAHTRLHTTDTSHPVW